MTRYTVFSSSLFLIAYSTSELVAEEPREIDVFINPSLSTILPVADAAIQTDQSYSPGGELLLSRVLPVRSVA